MRKFRYNQKEYQFYVVQNGTRILSGWEYREDAKENLMELPETAKLNSGIYKKSYVQSHFGIDLNNNKNWEE